MSELAKSTAFGTVFGEHLPIARFDGQRWSAMEVVPLDSVSFHPATHALHYGSECFEGMKAHRQIDGSVKAFRPEKNIERLLASADGLCLPVPSFELVSQLVQAAIDAHESLVPDSPGALYLRPNILGTDLNIGSASKPSNSAAIYVIASPVGEYLPPHPLRVVVETQTPRTTPQFGRIKCGSNYAMAVGVIRRARQNFNADQVLFAPGGYIEETGAANFMLIEEGRLITAPLSDAYLHGITRDSLLQVASSLGWQVEEKPVSVEDLLNWAARPNAECALAGTAAILGPVGTLIVNGEEHPVGSGKGGPATPMLRTFLNEIQIGKRKFEFAHRYKG